MQLSQVIDWLQSPRAERVARLTALVLGLWLLYRIAVLVWAVVPAPEPLPPPPVPAAGGAAPAGKPRLDVGQIVAWHLFGSAARTEAGAGPAPIDAPETRLNLVLRGVLSSDDPEEARAIIAEPNGTENYFRVGSALPGGAELKEIHADRIILLRAGRHETLRLPREAVEGGNAPAGSRALPGGAGAGAGALLGEYRDQAAENPQALLDLARAVPFNDGNGFAGFRVFPGNKPGLFGQLGLRPGDLVKEVNGVVLNSPESGVEAMRLLRESSQLALRIERGGQEINLAVDIP